MKRKFIFATLLFTFNLFSQSEALSEDEILYYKGNAIIDIVYGDDFPAVEHEENEIKPNYKIRKIKNLLLLNSFDYYNRIVTEHKNSKYYKISLFQIAAIAYDLERKNEARKNFEKLIVIEDIKYVCYRNTSLLFLTSLELENKNNKQAKLYFDEITANGTNFLCGGESQKTKKKLKKMYKKCKIALKE